MELGRGSRSPSYSPALQNHLFSVELQFAFIFRCNSDNERELVLFFYVQLPRCLLVPSLPAALPFTKKSSGFRKAFPTLEPSLA